VNKSDIINARGDKMIPVDKIRIQVTLAIDLKDKAELKATAEDRTLSNLITIALKQYLEKEVSK